MLRVGRPVLHWDRSQLRKVLLYREDWSNDRLTCAVKRWISWEGETAVCPTVADIGHRDNILRSDQLKKIIDS